MGLARAWRLRLYASLGLAVIVPLALMVSLALLALGGGSFSLASLRQALSGPSAPVVQPVPLRLASLPAASTAPNPHPGAALVAAARVTRPGGGTHPSHRSGAGSRTGGAGPRGAGSWGRGGGSGASGRGGSGYGGGGSPPPAHPTAVDKIVNAVTPVTSKLPAPAGPALTNVVTSAGATADKLLGGLPK